MLTPVYFPPKVYDALTTSFLATAKTLLDRAFNAIEADDDNALEELSALYLNAPTDERIVWGEDEDEYVDGIDLLYAIQEDLEHRAALISPAFGKEANRKITYRIQRFILKGDS